MFNPSGLLILTGSTTSSGSSGKCRSRSLSLTRTATMVRSSPNRSSPVVVVSVTRCSRVLSEAMVIDMLDTVYSSSSQRRGSYEPSLASSNTRPRAADSPPDYRPEARLSSRTRPKASRRACNLANRLMVLELSFYDRQISGDWRSGSALRSHRRGHWFEPSIAHYQGPGQEHVWSTPSRRRTDYSSKVQQWVSIRLVNPGSLCERI